MRAARRVADKSEEKRAPKGAVRGARARGFSFFNKRMYFSPPSSATSRRPRLRALVAAELPLAHNVHRVPVAREVANPRLLPPVRFEARRWR